ncbi:MAG: cation-translocating P-type ATPase, partial [Candidatus Aminicenantes bacterium]
VLVLTPGTKVAADAEIRQGIDLQSDESPLTGESFPQNKSEGSKVYAGTVIASGEGQAEVLATGRDTKLGKTADTLRQIKPPRTALQLAMKSLAGKLVYIAVFFSIFIPALGVLRGQDLKLMILTGLSLSFATIPEELPIVITMVLGLGAYKLSKNNFLVKKLKAAETLGNATVIVTDKTGTITEGKMRIVSLYPEAPKNEQEIIETALYTISQYSLSPMDQEIKNKAAELQIADAGAETLSTITHQRNFGNGRKTKSVIRKIENKYELFASGAPEEIISMCKAVDNETRDRLVEQTSRGRRVIAVAFKELLPGAENLDFSELEKDLDLTGLISFEDPPRNGVKETIARASRAGIRTIMVTGDHVLTALSIAQDVGISPKDGRALTGADLDRMSDEELRAAVKKVSVFARTTPQHKYRIVQALQKDGEVVAVTGDGINDVLALKGADIGIAMGIRGTDVAREAGDVVLADDNYNTIAQGIFEGRKFFDNLQKGIKYYLSVKTALILIFLLPVIIGIPLPFAPIQIIILELFMDLAASAGFVAEPREKDIYSRPPRDPHENIINSRTVKDILVNGGTLFVAVTAVYLFARSQGLSLVQTQTLAFSAWIFGHVVLAFISRSDKETVFSLGVFSNKIISLWALAAFAFLILGIYLPQLGAALNLSSVAFTQLIFTALAVLSIMSFLELRIALNPANK